MRSLITVSSTGHLHGAKSLAGPGGKRRTARGAIISACDKCYYSQWCCVEQRLDQGEGSPT